MRYLRCGDQTQEQYATIGRTYVTYDLSIIDNYCNHNYIFFNENQILARVYYKTNLKLKRQSTHPSTHCTLHTSLHTSLHCS